MHEHDDWLIANYSYQGTLFRTCLVCGLEQHKKPGEDWKDSPSLKNNSLL